MNCVAVGGGETPEKGPQEDKKLRERWRGREDERDPGHQMPPDRPQGECWLKRILRGGSLCS